jgi:hypothetical protein
MHVKVDPDDVQELTTDERGRVYLGSEYADTTVEVAVVAVKDDD